MSEHKCMKNRCESYGRVGDCGASLGKLLAVHSTHSQISFASLKQVGGDLLR